MMPKISASALQQAAGKGADYYFQLVLNTIKAEADGRLTAGSMTRLNAEQITLWAYGILREEVMDGGFVQLIYNGYAPFFFHNPFAKAMRMWGLHDLAKLVNKAKKLYQRTGDDLTRERTDEEFMALFEKHPEFDDLDDTFVEEEERFTTAVAQYVEGHIGQFVLIE